ncbi:DUF885 family protein [Arcticibacter sp. MXS-1]|uniref:DUF885 family protein n=1 Tax=Arcticibacter sp. MXS-1 TaxID=3341726 RepID=UPI0035A82F83
MCFIFCFAGKQRSFVLAALFAGISVAVAQERPAKFDLYEQASEMTGYSYRYEQDIRAIGAFYSPREVTAFYSRRYRPVLNSPEQRRRLLETDQSYLRELESLDFEAMSVNGKVDYTLLKRNIAEHSYDLQKEEREYQEVAGYMPFAARIYEIEKGRRRGASPDAQKLASELDQMVSEVRDASQAFRKKVQTLDKRRAELGADALNGLRARLKAVNEFYSGYDPLFSWWVPAPYKALDSALTTYSELMSSRGKFQTSQKADGSGIKGRPIGREELIRQLKVDMIPYTPEELIELANREFAWCDQELLRASREMGFGEDWKKAQEKVKNSYVPVGKQPELILKLYNDAITFIRERDLITIPPLADETWEMIMMSPERQLVNPFFTGGREISISYPTNTMEHQDKLMSMRGNNPYFSRGTVQHELIPGHNLQFFMNSRYKPYRENFNTPFWTEGWALYWELLLYDMGFAKSPEERIGMLFWRMHRCARIIFSLNYHLGKWTPQQCIDFLVDRVGHERANAAGEVRRSFEGGYSPLYQVAYLVGGLQIMSLKKELVDSGKMTYRDFNDAVMKENGMPIEMLRAILTRQPPEKNFTTKWKFYNFNNNN